MSRAGWFAGALFAAVAVLPAPSARADAAAVALEKEYVAAARALAPATVVCTAKGAPKGHPGSTGVVVHKSGWILSDRDAANAGGGSKPDDYRDEVEVRVPDLQRSTYKSYVARVVRRVHALDSTLLRIVNPPSGGFPAVACGSADALRVGSPVFVMGNSFGFGEEGAPTFTAGIVSALVRAKPEEGPGLYKEIYTSAAVNSGVNGGPFVDADGNLLGVVSSFVAASSAYQFLGLVIPVDRVRAAYRDLPDAATVFPDVRPSARSKRAALFEAAIEAAARRVQPCVASLDVLRSEPYEMRVPSSSGPQVLPRWRGAVSGVVASEDGCVVTSLYNLTNVVGLADPLPPDLADVEGPLQKIVKITACFPGGVRAPARLLARDERLGIALVKADLGDARVRVPDAAPADSFQVGRFVVAVGNPFGDPRAPDPLVTLGILSRLHPEDAAIPGDGGSMLSRGGAWGGAFQTDAGGTDGNCGGALVDSLGRILGVSSLWKPAQHGRNSGISFGVPWSKVLQALPSLRRGVSVRTGHIGITCAHSVHETASPTAAGEPAGPPTVIRELYPRGPASKAGVQVGDVILEIDGLPIDPLSISDAMRHRFEGDRIHLVVQRQGKRVGIDVVLEARPPGR